MLLLILFYTICMINILLVVLGDQGFVGGAEACVFAFSVLGASGE
jgi:hypothetical protein